MNEGKAIPFWMKTLSGMSSGAIAVTIGTPMDVALVRMQSDSMKPANERRNYKHVLDALRRCAAEEGVGALYAVRLSSATIFTSVFSSRASLYVPQRGHGIQKPVNC